MFSIPLLISRTCALRYIHLLNKFVSIIVGFRCYLSQQLKRRCGCCVSAFLVLPCIMRFVLYCCTTSRIIPFRKYLCFSRMQFLKWNEQQIRTLCFIWTFGLFGTKAMILKRLLCHCTTDCSWRLLYNCYVYSSARGFFRALIAH